MEPIEYNIQKRERKIDTSKLSAEDAEALAKQINEKVVSTGDRVVEELNNFLRIYGLKAKVHVALEELEPKGK